MCNIHARCVMQCKMGLFAVPNYVVKLVIDTTNYIVFTVFFFTCIFPRQWYYCFYYYYYYYYTSNKNYKNYNSNNNNSGNIIRMFICIKNKNKDVEMTVPKIREKVYAARQGMRVSLLLVVQLFVVPFLHM